MKLLIINGSPREHGNIARMLEVIKEEAEANGALTTYVQISSLRVEPCKGCMSCRKNRDCVLPQDDAPWVIQQLRDCDVLVIGAPCYWGNMPGQLKVLFDRIVYGLIGEDKRGLPVPLHKGKKAMVVSTCTTPYPFNILFHQSRGTVRALKEILRWSGFKPIRIVERGSTRYRTVGDKEFRRCRETIRKMLNR